MAGSLGRSHQPDGISANAVARKIAANPQFAKVIFQELEGLVREKEAAAMAAQEEADRLAKIRDGFDFERVSSAPIQRTVSKAPSKPASPSGAKARAPGRAPSSDTAKVREALFKAVLDAGKSGIAKGGVIEATGATQGQYALGMKALEKEGKIEMRGERKNARWYAR